MSRMASRVMKAIRVTQFGGPEVLKLATDVPVPSPGEGQVLIKIFTAGVNPVDTYIRNGTYPNLPTLPYTPGMDCAGVIEEAGPGVTKFKKGDQVYTVRSLTGTYAEYMLASTQYTCKLHPKMSFSKGSGIGVPYSTAYRALKIRGNAKEGELLLVHGASGSVGIATCQLGKALGLRVLGTAGSEKGMSLVEKVGAEKAFNHKNDDYIKEIKEYVGESGINIIVEMLANVNLENDLQMLGKNGRVMVVGNRGTVEINPRNTMGKESDIRGVQLMVGSKDEFEQIEQALWEAQDKGWISPVIANEYPLADADKAHEDVIEHSEGTKGRIILSMN